MILPPPLSPSLPCLFSLPKRPPPQLRRWKKKSAVEAIKALFVLTMALLPFPIPRPVSLGVWTDLWSMAYNPNPNPNPDLALYVSQVLLILSMIIVMVLCLTFQTSKTTNLPTILPVTSSKQRVWRVAFFRHLKTVKTCSQRIFCIFTFMFSEKLC